MPATETIFSGKFYRGASGLPLRRTTASQFAPMQLERRVLLVMLPAIAAVATLCWALDLRVGFSTLVEEYELLPLSVAFTVLFIWTLRARATDLRRVRYASLLIANVFVLQRFGVGLWDTAAQGYDPALMRNMLPWLILTSLLCIFLVPGRLGLGLALGQYGIQALLLVAFVIFNTQPLPHGLVGDLVVTHIVAYPLILTLCAVFAKLRVAYGKALARAEDLQVMALEDALTGIYNRRAFSLAFRRARARFHRSNRAVSVLLLDIDFFKKINDTYGHSVGDHALRSLAGVLLSQLRRTDEVFRVGGEEFAILLEETALQGAWEVAERIRQEVRKAALLPETRITISIGVAELSEGEGEGEVFARCDRALYAAKDAGRDRVQAAPPAGSEDDNGLLLKAI